MFARKKTWKKAPALICSTVDAEYFLANAKTGKKKMLEKYPQVAAPVHSERFSLVKAVNRCWNHRIGVKWACECKWTNVLFDYTFSLYIFTHSTRHPVVMSSKKLANFLLLLLQTTVSSENLEYITQHNNRFGSIRSKYIQTHKMPAKNVSNI